jgi:hypothetical protein
VALTRLWYYSRRAQRTFKYIRLVSHLATDVVLPLKIAGKPGDIHPYPGPEQNAPNIMAQVVRNRVTKPAKSRREFGRSLLLVP